MILDGDSETFVIHDAVLKAPKLIIYLSKIAQIIIDKNVRIASLQQVEALTKIFLKYVNYFDLFLYHLTRKLSENTSINKNVIKLEWGK